MIDRILDLLKSRISHHQILDVKRDYDNYIITVSINNWVYTVNINDIDNSEVTFNSATVNYFDLLLAYNELTRIKQMIQS